MDLKSMLETIKACCDELKNNGKFSETQSGKQPFMPHQVSLSDLVPAGAKLPDGSVLRKAK